MQRPSPLRWQTWLAFLAVNIIVSAITAFVVVRVLTLSYSRPSGSTVPAEAAAAVPTETATVSPTTGTTSATSTALDPRQNATEVPPRVRIVNVSYPGQRARERVVLLNEGTPIDLSGWQLISPRGQVYTFGNVVLLDQAYLNVNTARGTDTPTDLFWNLDEPVWRSGDLITLKRGDQVIATFVVP